MEHSIRTPSYYSTNRGFVRSHSSLYSHIPSLKSFKRLGTWKIFKCMKLSDWDKGLSMTNMHYYSLYNYSQMNMVITYRVWLFFVWLLKFKNIKKICIFLQGKYTRAFAERPLRWHSSLFLRNSVTRIEKNLTNLCILSVQVTEIKTSIDP